MMKKIDIKKHTIEIIIAIFLFLVTILIFRTLFFIRGFQLNFKDKLNDELAGLTSFVLKEDVANKSMKLVANIATGQLDIIDVTVYSDIEYDFNKNVIFLYGKTNDVGSLYIIELTKGNGNYTIEKLTDFDKDKNVIQIASVDQYVYYLLDGDNFVYRYDVLNNTNKKTTLNADVIFSLKDNHRLVYSYNGNSFFYDLENDKQDELSTGGTIKYTYANKVVYESLYMETNGKFQNYYFHFNIDNTPYTITKSNRSSFPIAIPYNGGYVLYDYTDNYIKKVSANGVYSNIIKVESVPSSLILLPNNVLQVQKYNNDVIANKFNLNIETKKSQTVDNNINYYNQIFVK